MRKRVLWIALSCALVCGFWGCENSEMTTEDGTGTPSMGTPGGQQPGGKTPDNGKSCGVGEYGCAVDNDTYCDGACGEDEYCLLGSDLESGTCSPCEYSCEHVSPLYPLCVVLDGDAGAVCVARGECPDGYKYDAGVGHYVCSGE